MGAGQLRDSEENAGRKGLTPFWTSGPSAGKGPKTEIHGGKAPQAYRDFRRLQQPASPGPAGIDFSTQGNIPGLIFPAGGTERRISPVCCDMASASLACIRENRS